MAMVKVMKTIFIGMVKAHMDIVMAINVMVKTGKVINKVMMKIVKVMVKAIKAMED